MAHTRRIDRTNPGCFMFLIDQSYSMNEPVAGQPDTSKAKALARSVNELLYELVIRCVKNPDEGPRHYYDVGVIGYGNAVGPAWGGSLSGRDIVSIGDIANNPIRIEQVDGGGDRSTTSGPAKRIPVWFEATADGATPMSAAMDHCGALLAGWIKQHPTSFPPIVVNISDGAATDGDPSEWARRLTSLKTQDGSVLLFNLNLSAIGGDQISFPSSADGLDDFARLLFDLSSQLPGFMQEVAGAKGYRILPGARGFVFNADLNSLVSFLQVGTATHHLAGA